MIFLGNGLQNYNYTSLCYLFHPESVLAHFRFQIINEQNPHLLRSGTSVYEFRNKRDETCNPEINSGLVATLYAVAMKTEL